MKINHKILSIPPYISTAWRNISSIYQKEPSLLNIVLISGSEIEIPNLTPESIHKIFQAYEKHLEQENLKKEKTQGAETPENGNVFSFGIPLSMGMEGMENLGSMMQHNSEQKNAPDLPKEILNKIASLSKNLNLEKQGLELPNAEPHCNCPYCQIARAMQQTQVPEYLLDDEDDISEEDLRFRDWEIKEENEHLFTVTNPLNKEEHYQVFLGNPIGCTCGEKNCEHIRAALNS